MFTSRITAPLGSVRSPVKVARASVCANETSGKVTARAAITANSNQLVFMSSSSPSRAGVEGCPKSAPRDVFSTAESGLRLRRSPGLAAILVVRPSHSGAGSRVRISDRNSGAHLAIPPLQSRGGDGFSPSSRARSLGHCERRAEPAKYTGCLRRGNFASCLCCLLLLSVFLSLFLLSDCSSNSNFKSQVRNLNLLVSNLKYQIWNLKSEVAPVFVAPASCRRF